MIDILTKVWERALKRKRIGAGENFFDLGGDPASANRLFVEIRREFGRELSPLTIYQAPTIDALALILECPALPKFHALVRLRDGADEPPVFICPGVGGTVMELFQLVKHIDSERPIYGLQSPGMDGVSEPLKRVEDIAQHFLEALRRLQPHGPFILIGHSFGGLVVLEMAQRLVEQRERVALLSLMESYPYRSHAPFRQKAGIAMRRAKSLMSKTLRQFRLKSLAGEIVDSSLLDRPEVGETFTPIMLRASNFAHLTWQRYRPRHYKGRINFVRSNDILPWLPDDPTAVWSQLTDEFVVETVPGNHYDILTRHSRTLAVAISRYLKKIPSGYD